MKWSLFLVFEDLALEGVFNLQQSKFGVDDLDEVHLIFSGPRLFGTHANLAFAHQAIRDCLELFHFQRKDGDGHSVYFAGY